MADLDPQATHDVLVIIGRLQQLRFGVTDGELHCFAYVACLAWLHDQGDAATWGYEFTALRSARPFAAEIEEALRECRSGGRVQRTGEVLTLTESGTSLAELLRGSVADHGRRSYVEAACDLAVAITIPTALAALTMEPQLQRSAVLSSERPLFDPNGQQTTSAELRELAELLPEASTLLARMTLWVSYWAAKKEREDRDFAIDA